jgi:transcriptional regulator with XRE-family HTH domain
MRMDADKNRKDLPLTRVAIERATQQERLSYGLLIEQLRKSKHLKQTELEEMSGVTSRTIRNIETGAVAGQADNLIRLFIALEVDLDGDRFVEVQPQLAIVAPMLLNIHPDWRNEAIQEVIPTLAEQIRLHPVDSPAPASMEAHRKSRVRGSRQDHLTTVELHAGGLAASTDNTSIPPDQGA